SGRENNIFSFLGMAPKDDPQLIMHVSVKQPELPADESGSAPVAFIFKNVMENGLHYLNIEPDKENEQETIETVTFPAVKGKEAKKVEKELEKSGATITVVGKGNKVTDANVEEGSSFFPNQRIILLTDKPTMPDVAGWSQRDVLKLADLLDLKADISGSGYVSKQSIEAGKKIKENETLKIELSSPFKE